ncbi:MAG: putative rane protein [Betaproteobacteria bacterium]|nr:putative rane protein [Betaproteobacteria bacterium]
MSVSRLLKHLLIPDWVARRPFSGVLLDRVEAAIHTSEQSHDAELQVALEPGLHLAALLRGLTPRARAVEVFSQLRVWDTERNSGVLIYLQLIDHAIEIVADRGINAKVPQAQWDEICRRMERAFAEEHYEQGVLTAIDDVTTLLAQHFPPVSGKRDELPDRPAML